MRGCLQTPLGKIHIPLFHLFFFFFKRILWSEKLKETIHNRDNVLSTIQVKSIVWKWSKRKEEQRTPTVKWMGSVCFVFLIMENVDGMNWSCLISGFDFLAIYITKNEPSWNKHLTVELQSMCCCHEQVYFLTFVNIKRLIFPLFFFSSSQMLWQDFSRQTPAHHQVFSFFKFTLHSSKGSHLICVMSCLTIWAFHLDRFPWEF